MANKQNRAGGRHLYLIPLFIIAICLFIVVRPKMSDSTQIVVDDNPTEHIIIHSESDSTTVEYKPFDPNTADYRTLISSGVPRNIAVNILKWRESGKVFRIKEDLALCYGMTDSLFFELEPYITIGEEFKIKRGGGNQPYANKSPRNTKKERHQQHIDLEPFMLDTVGESYLELVGFTPKQAELVVRYRDIIGGYTSFEKFKECYAVDSIMAERLRPYIVFPEPKAKEEKRAVVEFPVEINSADVATLVCISGIGQTSAQHIVRYRELLGGYYSVEQISELQVVTTENFQRILPQICCDNSKIKKININFAAQNELETHPYLSSRMLKRIMNKRQLKGGWSTIEEMIDDNIFTKEEAARIAPYLLFGTDSE
ncbi:MAG: helix-hairpin-helix domain-containing protein [Alistipes sp.]|nr:helix-hairpin-helix domain-containing protein [Alistipes sp.]